MKPDCQIFIAWLKIYLFIWFTMLSWKHFLAICIRQWSHSSWLQFRGRIDALGRNQGCQQYQFWLDRECNNQHPVIALAKEGARFCGKTDFLYSVFSSSPLVHLTVYACLFARRLVYNKGLYRSRIFQILGEIIIDDIGIIRRFPEQWSILILLAITKSKESCYSANSGRIFPLK